MTTWRTLGLRRSCGENGAQMHFLAFEPSRMHVENDIAGLIALLAPLGLIYGWYFYFTRIRCEPTGWRNRISVLSLSLASVGALLWPVTMIFAPKADWGSYVGVDRQVHFVESWEKVAVYTLLVAFVLCFFGRPRLIAPVAVACLGITLFWFSSTIP
jgi:hypothetical protein